MQALLALMPAGRNVSRVARGTQDVKHKSPKEPRSLAAAYSRTGAVSFLQINTNREKAGGAWQRWGEKKSSSLGFPLAEDAICICLYPHDAGWVLILSSPFYRRDPLSGPLEPGSTFSPNLQSAAHIVCPSTTRARGGPCGESCTVI